MRLIRTSLNITQISLWSFNVCNCHEYVQVYLGFYIQIQQLYFFHFTDTVEALHKAVLELALASFHFIHLEQVLQVLPLLPLLAFPLQALSE